MCCIFGNLQSMLNNGNFKLLIICKMIDGGVFKCFNSKLMEIFKLKY